MQDTLTCAHCNKPIKSEYTIITGLGAYHYVCLSATQAEWRNKFKEQDPRQLCFDFVYTAR